MSKKIIVDAKFPTETRVVVHKNGSIIDLKYENNVKKPIKGNLYLAKVIRIEPALQAAFIEYGGGKNGFLPFNEIHTNYYNIPVSDKEQLIKSLADEIKSDSAKAIKDIKPSSLKQVDSDEIDLKQIEELVDKETGQDIDIEQVDIDDPEYKQYIANAASKKDYNIQEVIKIGQVILVQAIKEERGNKGALFSSYISLAGRYCVLMPNTGGQSGVSKKISNSQERRRLQQIVQTLTSSKKKQDGNLSLIVRTIGMRKSAEQIEKDYQYLINLWNNIRNTTLKSEAPSFIYEQDNVVRRFIRDALDSTVKEFVIQGAAAYENAKKFAEDIAPEYSSKIKQYKGKRAIFSEQGIEQQIASLYKPSASLPSGGYIVINPTEALISIDVNSGKDTSEKNIEETALKTNLEAARQVARQVRLRDLSGIIVIDFIDMQDVRNRRIIERSLKEFLRDDTARIHTSSISRFGLLEMSRQRLMPSFSEYHSDICTHCNGKGLVRGGHANSMLILRTLEDELAKAKSKPNKIRIFAHQNSVLYLLNNKREEIRTVENNYRIKIQFQIDNDANADVFSIEMPKEENLSQIADFSKSQTTNKNSK